MVNGAEAQSEARRPFAKRAARVLDVAHWSVEVGAYACDSGARVDGRTGDGIVDLKLAKRVVILERLAIRIEGCVA